jgi:circadian clock protein KaiC
MVTAPNHSGCSSTGYSVRVLPPILAMDLPEPQESALFSPEAFIADTIVLFGIQHIRRGVQRTIEVLKSRGQEYLMGVHSFDIINGKGIEVYRRVQMRRSVEREHAAASDPKTRVASGIPGLDELSNGGYLRGSSTMVAGVSGTSKTVMGLQFLREAVRRGERGLLISLDEPPDQLIRNAITIGFNLRAAMDAGLTRLLYEPPQELQIDRHFAQIEQIMEHFKPHRVVTDSLSTYHSSIGTTGKDYRDFLRALVALMKHHQATAVYNHENPEILGMTSMMGHISASSLVDNIILMNWVELGDTFRHALTIAKMRAAATNHTTHECEVIDGEGLHVLPRPIGGILRPFSSYIGLISRAPERNPESPPPR